MSRQSEEGVLNVDGSQSEREREGETFGLVKETTIRRQERRRDDWLKK